MIISADKSFAQDYLGLSKDDVSLSLQAAGYVVAMKYEEKNGEYIKAERGKFQEFYFFKNKYCFALEFTISGYSSSDYQNYLTQNGYEKGNDNNYYNSNRTAVIRVDKPSGTYYCFVELR